MIQHVRFGELAGCTEEVADQFRQWGSVASYFQSVGSQEIKEAETRSPERLVELLDRFTYPYTIRFQIVGLASQRLPPNSPFRSIILKRLRATGRQVDQQLARLMADPLVDFRRITTSFSPVKIVNRNKMTGVNKPVRASQEND
jgi:hypothetical protein